MRVKFVEGPLNGREEEIPDDRLQEGQPVYWPARPDEAKDDPETPGLDGSVEYLYDGDGTARYVGGRPPDE